MEEGPLGPLGSLYSVVTHHLSQIPSLAPRSWARCLTDMRWLRHQVIAPLTEELVFRACMLPMLAPCTGLGPAVFTCPLFFGVGEFVFLVLLRCC